MENVFASLSDFLFGILCFVVDFMGLPLVFPLIICFAIYFDKKNPGGRKHSDYGWSTYYGTDLATGAIIAELKNLGDSLDSDKQ